MKLKHAIEQRPSHEVVWEIQQEKELLLAKNQELENTLQVGGVVEYGLKGLLVAARAAMDLVKTVGQLLPKSSEERELIWL